MQRLIPFWVLVLLLGVNQVGRIVAGEDRGLEDFHLDDDDEGAAALMSDMEEEDEDDDVFIPDDDTKVSTPAPAIVESVPYVAPKTTHLEFAETFDGDVFSRWVKSSNSKFSGEWSVQRRQSEAIAGDVGLRVMEEARHHGISAKLPKPMTNNLGRSLVFSYEVKFEESLNCGGAYLKFFSSSALPGGDLAGFDNETPYVLMFGPDRCGATNKVHVIVRQQNPKSNEWVEHHLVDPPRVSFSRTTHLYTLEFTPDNKYKIWVNDKVEKEGDMNTDFDPPFTPPAEINDPDDVKPKDWVDAAKIPDPDAMKPEDWDEDAPRMIEDAEATMPEGWLESEPAMVPDLEAEQPEEWDEEQDGKWEPPLIQNPLCSVGCGQWTPPQIPNPAYKGKWSPPLINNPAFKGPWHPRKIPNPHYFVSKNPHALGDFDAVGFELWTMQKGILFDNIVVARDILAVKQFVSDTWVVRHAIEASMESATAVKPTEGGLESMGLAEKLVTGAMFVAGERPIFAVGFAGVLLGAVVMLIKLCKRPSPPKPSGASTPQPAEEGKKSERGEPTEHDKTKTSSGAEEESEEEEEEEEEGEELAAETKPTTARQRVVKKD